MKTAFSPRTLLSALLLLVSPASLHAQTLDWGDWSNSGTGAYDNGDTIIISGVVNASTTPANDENLGAHSIIDPAFPYANQPGAGEYGFFHNTTATASGWSVKIDLSNFTMTSDTVIGFSNLDGRDFNTLAPTTATILFLDAQGNPVSIGSSTILGSYDTNWSWFNWTGNSTFDRSSGTWGVVADQGGFPPGSYFGAVSDAFFLTNLPTNVSSILFTHNGGTSYEYDSTLFYAGNIAVPEPSAFLLGGVAGVAGLLRRRRGR